MRFSTITCCFHRSESLSAKIRATMSEAPPAGNVTIIFTGRAGYSCAIAESATQRQLKRKTRRIDFLGDKNTRGKSGSEPEFAFAYARTNSGSDPELSAPWLVEAEHHLGR